MKNFLVYTLVILLFPTLVFAQNGLINSNQIAPVAVTVQAGEALTPGQVVSLINESGTMKAYNNALTVSTSPNGAESVFNAAATTLCSATAIDTTRFLVAYKDADDTIRAIVGTVTGSTIAWGSESASISATAEYISTCKIGTDKILIAYSDGTKGRAAVLSISTTTITANASVDSNAIGRYMYVSVSTLENDKAIVTYRENGDSSKGYAGIISVSTTTPSFGDIVKFNDAATAYISVSALSSTSAIVAYQDGGNSNYGTAQVLSISGTTITPGTEYVYEDSGLDYNSVSALDSTKSIIFYRDSGDSYKSKTLIATNTAGELTFGTISIVTTVSSSFQNVFKIDSTHAIVQYQDNTANSHKNKLAIISGTDITLSSEYTAQANVSQYMSGCYLGLQKSIMAFQDLTNSSYGTAVVNTAFNADYSSVRGLSTAAVNSGETATVLLSGMASGLSSITQGQQYWLNTDHTMSTAPVSLAIMKNSSTQTGEIFLGVGKSSTEMWFNVDYK